MKVSSYMTKAPITVSPEASVAEAARLLRENRIRQLPVLSQDRLVGIITDRDVRGREGGTPVARAMTPQPLCASPETPMEEVAHILRERKIGSLPVTDRTGRLVGIVTESDVFKAFEEIARRGEPSYLLELTNTDSTHAIGEILDVMQANGARIRHLAAQEAQDGGTKLTVYFTASRMGDVQDALEARGLGGAIVALGGEALRAFSKPAF